MGTKKKVSEEETQYRKRPAVTPESKEKQMVALAVDLAETQLREGTASSQVITHFLKLGTTLANLEREKLENENLLLKAKIENLQSSKSSDEMYKKALDAMMIYSGNAAGVVDED